MSDTLTSQAENLRTLALAAEQDIESARLALDAAVVRRDRLVAAADLLDPDSVCDLQRFIHAERLDPGFREAYDRIEAERRLAAEGASLAKLPRVVTPAPVDEDPVADELPVTPTPKAKPGIPKGSPAVGGRPQQYDRAEVAQVCRLAIEEGRPQRTAVEEAFGCTPTMAGFLIADARKKGHDIPRTRAERAPKADTPMDTTPAPKVAPAQVTAPKPVDTGADKLQPLFPPGTPRPPFAPKVGESVLVCDDCGQPFERNVTRLSLHTHDTHQRPPHQAERLPRTWTDEDAEGWPG